MATPGCPNAQISRVPPPRDRQGWRGVPVGRPRRPEVRRVGRGATADLKPPHPVSRSPSPPTAERNLDFLEDLIREGFEDARLARARRRQRRLARSPSTGARAADVRSVVSRSLREPGCASRRDGSRRALPPPNVGESPAIRAIPGCRTPGTANRPSRTGWSAKRSSRSLSDPRRQGSR